MYNQTDCKPHDHQGAGFFCSLSGEFCWWPFSYAVVLIAQFGGVGICSETKANDGQMAAKEEDIL
jgi:hypothetical protein